MKNKIISLLLVSTLFLGLVACSQKQEVTEDAPVVEASVEASIETPDAVIEVNTDEKVPQKEITADNFKAAIESLGGSVSVETSDGNVTLVNGGRSGKLDILIGTIDGVQVELLSGTAVKNSTAYLENCITIDLVDTYDNTNTVSVGGSEVAVDNQAYAELLSIEGGNGYTSKQYEGTGYKYKVSYAGVGSYVLIEGTDSDTTLITQFCSALGIDGSESTFDEEYLYELRKKAFSGEESNVATEESSEGEEGEESGAEGTEESVEGATDGE